MAQQVETIFRPLQTESPTNKKRCFFSRARPKTAFASHLNKNALFREPARKCSNTLFMMQRLHKPSVVWKTREIRDFLQAAYVIAVLVTLNPEIAYGSLAVNRARVNYFEVVSEEWCLFCFLLDSCVVTWWARDVRLRKTGWVCFGC